MITELATGDVRATFEPLLNSIFAARQPVAPHRTALRCGRHNIQYGVIISVTQTIIQTPRPPTSGFRRTRRTNDSLCLVVLRPPRRDMLMVRTAKTGSQKTIYSTDHQRLTDMTRRWRS